MSYDGALASLTDASVAAARGDLRKRGAAILKAVMIVGALQESLNVAEGGAVAAELDRLYNYASGRLLDVTLKQDETALAEVHTLLTGLRDAWHQIATREQLQCTS